MESADNIDATLTGHLEHDDIIAIIDDDEASASTAGGSGVIAPQISNNVTQMKSFNTQTQTHTQTEENTGKNNVAIEATGIEAEEPGAASNSLSLDCPICLQACVHPARLPCGHIFCFLCIKGVAYKNQRCAMCRREIPPEFLDRPQLVNGIEEINKLKSADDGYQWFYEGRNGGWWEYDKRSSDEIEEVYRKYLGATVVDIENGGHHDMLISGTIYSIDFVDMVQYPKNAPVRRRKICRSKHLHMSSKGWWQYDARTSQDIEDAFEKGEKSCTILVAGFVYIVDLEAMVQQRQNEPTRCRRVKRDLATVPKKGVAGLRLENNTGSIESSVTTTSLGALDATTDNNIETNYTVVDINSLTSDMDSLSITIPSQSNNLESIHLPANAAPNFFQRMSYQGEVTSPTATNSFVNIFDDRIESTINNPDNTIQRLNRTVNYNYASSLNPNQANEPVPIRSETSDRFNEILNNFQRNTFPTSSPTPTVTATTTSTVMSPTTITTPTTVETENERFERRGSRHRNNSTQF